MLGPWERGRAGGVAFKSLTPSPFPPERREKQEGLEQAWQVCS